MREFNTIDIIKIIPFDQKTRETLLAEYEGYEEGKKFEVTKILWEAFDEMFEAIKAEKTSILMREVAEGKRHLTGNIAETVDLEVWAALEARLEKNPADDDSLSEIRNKLQHLITEN
ncbi:hypothetical protein KBD81_04225 [Candidatus Woesebacteria bacterium]|nr:hypothetical protein [Candidatus Woesebacteria bacterium]